MEKDPIKGRPIYGRRNVQEFLRLCPWNRIHSIWVKESYFTEAKKTILSQVPPHIPIWKKSSKDFELTLPHLNHQGMVVWVADPLAPTRNFQQFKLDLKPHQGPILILDRIQDPGNLGNILRSAECLGVRMVILSLKDSCGITEVVEKTSCGATHLLNIYQIPNLSQALDELKKKDYWILALTEKGDENWKSLPSKENVVLLLGSEGKGIKDILLKKSDFQLRIPMHGNLSSLNVGVACGIALDRIINS